MEFHAAKMSSLVGWRVIVVYGDHYNARFFVINRSSAVSAKMSGKPPYHENDLLNMNTIYIYSYIQHGKSERRSVLDSGFLNLSNMN